MPSEQWVWISLPYATFGIAVKNGNVVSAPPIARWMRGKRAAEAISWAERKGGEVVWIGDDPRA